MSRQTAARPSLRTRRLARLEPLEQRALMAADIFLDFNGASAGDIGHLAFNIQTNSGLADLADSGGALSFVGEFATLDRRYGGYEAYRFLDFDGNGRLNATDGEEAARQILRKVAQDFAPYDVRVFRQDDTRAAVNSLWYSTTKDAYVVIDGHHTNAGGQAPYDAGNRVDNGMGVGGSVAVARNIRDFRLSDGESRTAFINAFANLISHEVAHSFGLAHIHMRVHPNAISLMTPLQGYSDANFPDQSYRTEIGGLENAHQYLTTTLGASRQAWAAVLQPGVLTVQGSDNADSLIVGMNVDRTWRVQAGGRSYTLDPDASPDWNSLNPFPTAMHTVVMRGGGGNDFLSAGVPAGVKANLFGGAGDDTLFGHDGVDELYGDSGHDILVGRGGDDRLDGNGDRDILIGGSGADSLMGHAGDDLLIGGDTTFSNSVSSLWALRAAWTAGTSYSTRKASVETLLRGSVLDDRVRDRLFGGSELDLFVLGDLDETDAVTGEWRGRF